MSELARRTANWLFPAGVPLAWRQLNQDRNRLLAAVAGVILAVTSILFQTGAYNALFESAAIQYRALNADLIIHSQNYQYMALHTPISRDHVAEVLGDPAVDSAESIDIGFLLWKVPETGMIIEALAFGMDPAATALQLPEVSAQKNLLTLPDTLLFDRLSSSEFGNIEAALKRGEGFPVEINGQRCEVRGAFELGISFAADGQVIMSKACFNRLFPERPDFGVSLGLIRLKPGQDAELVRDRLQQKLGPELRVLTKKQLIRQEQRYWHERTPIGFIIPTTLLVVLLVGAVVFYQILYTDVQSHLPEYATLKAIGFHDDGLQSIVVQQSMLLALIGYAPGLLLAYLLFGVARDATQLPFALSFGQAALAFLLTFGMCLAAGMLAMRTLKKAQPADVFA